MTVLMQARLNQLIQDYISVHNIDVSASIEDKAMAVVGLQNYTRGLAATANSDNIMDLLSEDIIDEA